MGTSLKCLWCGGSFKSKGRGRPRKYCKPGCRQSAYNSRVNGTGEMWERFKKEYENCYLCSLPLGWNESPEKICLDHKVATIYGGRTTPENLRPVHVLCNLKKGGKWLAPDFFLGEQIRPLDELK